MESAETILFQEIKEYLALGASIQSAKVSIVNAMELYAISKQIEENKSILAMAELHMDERAIVVLKQRIFDLEKLNAKH